MANILPRDEVRAARKAAVENALQRGLERSAAITEAAKQLECARSTVVSWSQLEEREASAGRAHFSVDWSLYAPAEIVLDLPAAERPRIRVKAHSESHADGPIYRVCAIGDLHDSPHLSDKARFTWIARHIGETRPDRVVQIGDWASFDSVSRHDAPGSIKQKLRPSIAADFESLEESLSLIWKELGDVAIPRDVTLGNHEERLLRAEGATAEMVGLLWPRLYETFARYGWTAHDPYKYLYIGSVGFTHVPLNTMGRPYGGKTSENQIINDTTVSLVYGHTHRANVVSRPKIGPVPKLTVLNLGSAMPHGHVEPYAQTSLTGWSYGLFDLAIQAGQIVDHQFISMPELERKYA